jgi:hypothetical protein
MSFRIPDNGQNLSVLHLRQNPSDCTVCLETHLAAVYRGLQGNRVDIFSLDSKRGRTLVNYIVFSSLEGSFGRIFELPFLHFRRATHSKFWESCYSCGVLEVTEITLSLCLIN